MVYTLSMIETKLLKVEDFKVKLEIINTSLEDHFYLPLPRIQLNNIQGNWFDFTSPHIVYKGIQIKRAPYGADEVFKLDPLKTFESEVLDLTNFYDFKDVKSDELLQVRFNTSTTLSMDAPQILISNWVTLKFE